MPVKLQTSGTTLFTLERVQTGRVVFFNVKRFLLFNIIFITMFYANGINSEKLFELQILVSCANS